VGCTTPPTPEPEPEPTPTPTPIVSATPVLTAVETSAAVSIFDVTSTSTLYMNATELGATILIKGTAPSESLVQIYLDDVAITPAIAEAATSGLWTIAVAKSSLGDDGVKVLTATVTEVGLAESEASNAVTFTLDTTAPSISSVAFTANSAVAAAAITYTATTTSATVFLTEVAASGTTIPAQTIVTGTWTLNTVADSGVASNVAITTPAGVTTYYSVSDGAIIKDLYIPGITLTFGGITASDVAITILIAQTTAPTTLIAGRATVVFSEDIGYAGMAAGTYAGGLVAADPDVYKESACTGYYTSETITQNTTYYITTYGITDKAGNVGGTSAVPLSASATAAAASATALAP